ncbi:MAG TPA: hypothetical protein VK973_02770, partial [Arenicellales bacterium]|nr:hypothetical protein [Arenicellales bacterium]
MALEAEQAVCENTTRVVLRNNGRALSFVDVIDLWRGDKWFSGFFVETLAACRYRCFRFETPPAMSGTLDRPFEFVLVDSPEIDLAADPRDFQAHFDACADD